MERCRLPPSPVPACPSSLLTIAGPPPPPYHQDFVAKFIAGEAGLTRRRRALLQISHRATGLQSRDLILVRRACGGHSWLGLHARRGRTRVNSAPRLIRMLPPLLTQVMGAGQLLEAGSPSELLAKPGGKFR